MNWKYEAKRVAAAFGVEGRYLFRDIGAGKRLTKDGPVHVHREPNQNRRPHKGRLKGDDNHRPSR